MSHPALFFFMIILVVQVPRDLIGVLGWVSAKNIIGFLTGVVLNLQIALGSTDVLTVLSLKIHENRMFPFIYVAFNIFQQHIVVFIVQAFYFVVYS